MIRIRSAPTECAISGSLAALKSIAEALRRAASGSEEQIYCDPACDPKPYPSRLTTLLIKKEEGKDRVRRVSDSLVLSGRADGLIRFASFFEMPEDAADGFHVHHEASFGTGFVADDSLPLVVSIERAVQPARPDNAG
jgi:hypothetical protein